MIQEILKSFFHGKFQGCILLLAEIYGIVAMNDLQKKADFMLEDIKKKEADLYKLNNEVARAKMRF